MAEETISTAILTVATIIAAVVLLTAIYPSLYAVSGSILSMDSVATDRIRTDMTVLAEYPSSVDGNFVLVAWIKNTGSTTIDQASLGQSDVYLYTGSGKTTLISRSGGNPSWTYAILNGNGGPDWDPGETLQVTITYGNSLSPGTMKFRLALDNGVYTEDTFSWK